MNAELFRRRLAELIAQKGVSEVQMSRDLGRSKGYVQSLTSGRAMPTMKVFFQICDYLRLSPAQFFDVPEEGEQAEIIRRFLATDRATLRAIDELIRRIS